MDVLWTNQRVDVSIAGIVLGSDLFLDCTRVCIDERFCFNEFLSDRDSVNDDALHLKAFFALVSIGELPNHVDGDNFAVCVLESVSNRGLLYDLFDSSVFDPSHRWTLPVCSTLFAFVLHLAKHCKAHKYWYGVRILETVALAIYKEKLARSEFASNMYCADIRFYS